MGPGGAVGKDALAHPVGPFLSAQQLPLTGLPGAAVSAAIDPITGGLLPFTQQGGLPFQVSFCSCPQSDMLLGGMR